MKNPHQDQAAETAKDAEARKDEQTGRDVPVRHEKPEAQKDVA